VPSHRTIAEFLAARWLAQRIDQKGRPVTRILHVLAPMGGKTNLT